MTLMPELRRQLLAAAIDRSPASARRPRAALARPWTPIAAAVSVAVVATIVATVLLTPARRGVSTSRDRGRSTASRSTAQAGLLGELGVLRHGRVARVPAFLSFPNTTLQMVRERTLMIERSRVRSVTTRGYTVTFIPVSRALSETPHARRVTQLALEVRGPDVPSGFPNMGPGSYTIEGPISPAAFSRSGTITDMYVRNGLNRLVVVVPDGVTGVSLSRIVPEHSVSPGQPAAIPPASAPVHDNVAVVSLPHVTATTLRQSLRTVQGHGGIFASHDCRVTADLWFVPVSMRMIWRQSGHAGPTDRTVTVDTSLDGYSTTVLGPGPTCRRSSRR